MELNFKKLCGNDAGPNLGNVSEFHKLILGLMFLVNSNSDMCFAVSMLSSYMVQPHWIGAKNLLKYLRGTISHGLRCTVGNAKLHDYSDAHRASSVEDPKSTSGCWFSLGSTLISQMSRKKKTVVLSTAEAEYITMSMASYEVVWLWKFFHEMFGHVLDTIVIFCDNQRGIRLLRNPMFYDRSQHIDIKYDFIWDMGQQGTGRFLRTGTDVQVTNIQMKPLGKVKFVTFRERLGVVERLSLEGPI